MMMMILKAFVVFSYYPRETILSFIWRDLLRNHSSLFFVCFRLAKAFLSVCRFRRSRHPAENFLKRRKVINLFIRVYPTLLPRTVIIQTHRRTIKSSFSFFAVWEDFFSIYWIYRRTRASQNGIFNRTRAREIESPLGTDVERCERKRALFRRVGGVRSTHIAGNGKSVHERR